METENEQRIGYKKRFLLFALVLGGFLFWMAADTRNSIGAFLYGFLGLWFFIFATIRLLFPKPVLILDSSGLTVLSPRNPLGFIAWNEMQTIFCGGNGMGGELIVLPKDTQAFLARLSWYNRMNCKVSLWVSEAPLTIPLTGLTMSDRDIMIQIGQYWKAAVNEVLIIPPTAD